MKSITSGIFSVSCHTLAEAIFLRTIQRFSNFSVDKSHLIIWKCRFRFHSTEAQDSAFSHTPKGIPRQALQRPHWINSSFTTWKPWHWPCPLKSQTLSYFINCVAITTSTLHSPWEDVKWWMVSQVRPPVNILLVRRLSLLWQNVTLGFGMLYFVFK